MAPAPALPLPSPSGRSPPAPERLQSARAQIGPNAIVRLGEAVTARYGVLAAEQLFSAAGLAVYLVAPPARMVDEREVIRLHASLRAQFGIDASRDVSREAGCLTAQYLLAHRIPKPMGLLLPHLPARLASRILLAAMSRHAWTFAGSGHFSARSGRPVRLSLRDCPLCRDAVSSEPLCEFYAATFEHLFRVLIHANSRGVQTACAAAGHAQCEFEISW